MIRIKAGPLWVWKQRIAVTQFLIGYRVRHGVRTVCWPLRKLADICQPSAPPRSYPRRGVARAPHID